LGIRSPENNLTPGVSARYLPRNVYAMNKQAIEGSGGVKMPHHSDCNPAGASNAGQGCERIPQPQNRRGGFYSIVA
jgi:hypothetical protein